VTVDLILAVLPFADLTRPALGVSLLQAAVARRGFSSRVRYFNLDFAGCVGVQAYTRIADELPPDTLIGEWFFADCVFGNEIPDERDYLDQVLTNYPAGDGFMTDLLSARGSRNRFVERCVTEILSLRPRVVGFSTTFHQTCACLAVASRLKRSSEPPVVIFGGANCEGEMGLQLLRSCSFIDYVCTGEGDAAFPDFLERLLRDGDPTSVPGIISRANSATLSRPTMIRDLDALPIPDFANYFAELAASSFRDSIDPGLVFESSRGCWWGAKSHCTFCGLNGLTMTYRSKSPDRILDEFRALREAYRVDHFSGVDNILDLRYIHEVFPKLSESRLGLELLYETKTNLNFDQLLVLKKGGVRALQPGIESFSNEVLRLMGKGCTSLQNIQFLRNCEELGIQAMWNFLYGFPGESPAEYERQADLVPMLAHLSPPLTGAPFRLDRFSPMFMRPEEFGLARVRPNFAYYYVFPFGRSELKHLAYYFEFDYADSRDPQSYTHRIRQAIALWARSRQKPPEQWPRLELHRSGDALVLEDTRPCAVAGEHRLEGLTAKIYLFTDRVRGLRGLCRELAGEADEQSVRATLERLLAAKLMVEMDGQYLSLAVPRDRAPRAGLEEWYVDVPSQEAAPTQPLLHSL
jgi:ribosomal peptide maturation radical SAM protein 1